MSIKHCDEEMGDQIFAHLPGALAVLEYGGRVAGRSTPASDLDLLIVFARQPTPYRFHGPRVDINLLGLDSLQSLLQRLLINEERPWDGMFHNVRLLSCKDEAVTKLVKDI